ncbi:MAG: molybdenum cofactor biosysynthesis protein [Lacunisphaera sp.]|nr:molybdenum cofactor biosysynthesis protein [Lacunisphaera sp.]
MNIAALYISPGHNYLGHYGLPPGKYPVESVQTVECLAGRGLVADRFFDHKPDFAGQVTFFAMEVYEEIRRALNCMDQPPSVFRRNVLSRGLDLNVLIGAEFEVQGVRFAGMRECTPCYWMDQAFAPGAEAWLKGRGGLRARILTSGWLKVDAPLPC